MRDININKFSLKNGLRFVHLELKSSPMVVVNTLYDVGAKDEKENRTGLAHLMEHLMFGGSVNAPSYDQPMHNAGGTDNAWTSNDVTNFYDKVPKDNVETVFYLESDRMLSLSFSPESLKVQRHVVCEEFKERNLNQPYGDREELIRQMVFKQHPYKWLTIGKELKQIEDTTMEEVKDFFFSHYAPNNAIISVVGNISLEETKALAEKWYADIPVRDIKPRNIAPEPKQTEPRFMRVERDVPSDLIVKVYHAPNIKEEGYYVSDFLTDILSYSQSSRLNQRLVQDTHKFEQLNAWIGSLNDEGTIYISGMPADGVSIEEADKLILNEIEDLKKNPPTELEMEKVRNFYEADKLYPSDLETIASDLAMNEFLGDANNYKTQVERHNAVTSEQITAMAKELLVPTNCSTLYYCKKRDTAE